MRRIQYVAVYIAKKCTAYVDPIFVISRTQRLGLENTKRKKSDLENIFVLTSLPPILPNASPKRNLVPSVCLLGTFAEIQAKEYMVSVNGKTNRNKYTGQ